MQTKLASPFNIVQFFHVSDVKDLRHKCVHTVCLLLGIPLTLLTAEAVSSVLITSFYSHFLQTAKTPFSSTISMRPGRPVRFQQSGSILQLPLYAGLRYSCVNELQ